MYFTFKRNNQRTKKPVNRFLQDGASAGIQSLQTSIVVKLCQTPWNGFQWLQETPRKENLNHLNVKFPTLNLHQKAESVQVLDKGLTIQLLVRH